mmetsp:Transcript_40113/g.107548  ORF Transcript_40113/g.107548 Transcript_40113/m.107548 type:complete len:154 (-) Transcript_40113:54-515(-)
MFNVQPPSLQLASPQISRPKVYELFQLKRFDSTFSLKVDLGKSFSFAQPEAAKAKTGTKTASPKATPIEKTQDEDIPLFKVILLGDKEYEEAHVVTQITKLIPSVKEEAATRNYVEAQTTGSSVIILCPEEHAEHYVQQLRRQQIYARYEQDE